LTGQFDHYEPEQYDSREYYAFGSESRRGSNPWTVIVDIKQGFNNKEKSHKTNSQTNYDYGFRIYNAGIGKFLSVDPLTKKYPWWTPYQFAGNMPIKYIDLDGLEPANNPIDNKNVRAAKADVLTMASASNSQNELENFPNCTSRLCESYSNGCLNGMASKVENGKSYVTDTKKNSAESYNLWVIDQNTFNVDESNASSYNNYPLHVVNEMLQGFVNGTGPENYNFPVNGVISSLMFNSDIVQNALSNFESENSNNPVQYSFTSVNLLKNLVRSPVPFNVDGFVGSGTITIIPTTKGIQVEIFNVTSLTSGALTAKLPIGSWLFDMPKSYVRNDTGNTPFGNISQTYQLFIPKN